MFNVYNVEYILVKQYRFFPEARVAMTATQEEITETIMTTEMGHAHKIYTRNNTSDPGSSLQIAVFIKIFGAALKRLF